MTGTTPLWLATLGTCIGWAATAKRNGLAAARPLAAAMAAAWTLLLVLDASDLASGLAIPDGIDAAISWWAWWISGGDDDFRRRRRRAAQALREVAGRLVVVPAREGAS